MFIKFYLRFPYGEVIYYKDNHWVKFKVDDALRCLLDFSEVSNFHCVFNDKDREWVIEANITPMTIEQFETHFRGALAKFYSRKDATIEVSEMKLSKNEMDTFTTAYVMSKVENKGGEGDGK